MKRYPLGREEMEGASGLRDWHLCGRGGSEYSAGGSYTQDGDPGAGTSRPRSKGIQLRELVQRSGDQI